MICDNLSINEKGHLVFAGRDTVDLAQKYGTPLYVMDENKIREHMREYKAAFEKYFPEGSCPEYASKAFSCKQIYRIAAEEKMNIDVVSCGEIYTAMSTGYPMENCFFHGNNKTDEDIEFAMEAKVGCIVADSEEELFAINQIAKQKGITQKILLRVTPGIDTHTHQKISTGNVDSKFGIAIDTNQAKETVGKILKLQNIDFAGFHCHIGSQIFESGPFDLASELMFRFIKDIKDTYGYTPRVLNLGGGFGVRYIDSDPKISFAEKIAEIAKILEKQSKAFGIEIPKIAMEPGRSIVADAGLTLYSVGSVKEITGYKNYVSIDGGMTDNPRYTLYESPYTVILATRANDEKDFCATIAGRCCEEGDVIQENVMLPKPKRNEILAVLTTGAYNYSMASNYNRVPRPPVIMLNDKDEYIAVKRETLEDICALDI
ncbi:MAG: diaminopimelate decarboxylase [Clostridia bacterium]|nr:diaminopimelate decarboxylase [Clostridia bacterium]